MSARHERPCAGADCTDTAVGRALLCPDCADKRDELDECVELCEASARWLATTDAAIARAGVVAREGAHHNDVGPAAMQTPGAVTDHRRSDR